MTESRLSIALDENPDFQLVLEKYLKKLQENQPPSCKVTKYLLKKLNALGNEDLIKILETYVTDDHRERLIDLVLKHRGLAKIEKRQKIENARVDEAKNHPEWLEYNKQLIGEEERDAAELIGAVEMLYFLNSVNPRMDTLTRLNVLEPREVVMLGKLIGLFTKDYKILDLSFRLNKKEEQMALVENAIQILWWIYFGLNERHTPEEYRNYCNFILDYIDFATLEPMNNEAIQFLDGQFAYLSGKSYGLKSSYLIMAGLICNNMDRLRRREGFNIKPEMFDTYWSSVDGEPFMLAKLELTVSTDYENYKKRNVHDCYGVNMYQSIAFTTALAPLLSYAIESGKFASFDQAKLKEQASRMLTTYREIQVINGDWYSKQLFECLEKLSEMDHTNILN